MQDIMEKAAQIRLIIFDVDGVLTDGRLYLGDNGQEYKAFNSKDGHGMKMLRESGVEIGIITGRNSNIVEMRMKSLGIQHIYQGKHDKLPAFGELKAKLKLKNEQIAYVGDDVADLPVMCKTGLAIAVQDAHHMVKQHAHWHTPSAGGRGAAREACDLLMEAQGNLKRMTEQYLQ